MCVCVCMLMGVGVAGVISALEGKFSCYVASQSIFMVSNFNHPPTHPTQFLLVLRYSLDVASKVFDGDLWSRQTNKHLVIISVQSKSRAYNNTTMFMC